MHKLRRETPDKLGEWLRYTYLALVALPLQACISDPALTSP